MQDSTMGLKKVPSDEDLVSCLYEKVYGVTSSSNCNSDSEVALFECDLYGDKDPWQIWSEHGGLKLNKGEELYFFTKLKKLSINGSRFNRHTPSGTWSGVNRVSVGSGTGVADKRYFKYENRNSGSESVTWKMYEYSLVDGGADPTVICRLRREIKGQKRKLTNFIPTQPYFCSSSSSPSVGHHHHQQMIKKQRVGGNLHVDAADNMIDFGFLFDSDDEQDLKKITREEYIKKAAAVNVVKSPPSTTHHHHHQVDVVEEHSSYGGTENFVEIDDDDHGINNVATSSSTSTTAGQDHGDNNVSILSSSTATSHKMEGQNNNNNNVVGDQVDYNIGAVEQQNGMEAEDDEEYLSGKSFAELLQSVPLY